MGEKFGFIKVLLGTAVIVVIAISMVTHTSPMAVLNAQASRPEAKSILAGVKGQAQVAASGIGGNVLGAATKFMSGVASASAAKVEDMVFDVTVGNILKKIDTLPPDQQEKIRKYICK